MKTILPLLFLGVVVGSCLVGAAGKLPAFTVERWVNSAPLTAAGFRGKVVLVDVWEYTHLSLDKDAPIPRPLALASEGHIVAIPQLGGLHHRYERRVA